jgi:hypothetical protein|tara:strand:+ start:583 stop:1272 length:690 start_codon:yes stop_codon:yes gene_type:complete
MDGSTWLTQSGRVNPIGYLYDTVLYYCVWWLIYESVGKIVTKYSLLHRLSIEKHTDAKTRIVGSIHAFIITYYTCNYLTNNIGYHEWAMCLPISSAYGLLDITVLTVNYKYFKKGYRAICLHHLILIFGPLTITPEYGMLCSRHYLFEITVPILDMSWYLYRTKQTASLVYKVNSVLTVILFFIFRIMNGGYLVYTLGTAHQYMALAGTLTFLGLNIYWFKSLVSVVFT